MYTGERTPHDRPDRPSLYVNIPKPAGRAVGITKEDIVRVELHNPNGDQLTWYHPDRSVQTLGAGDSLYINIPSEAADTLNIDTDTPLSVTAYPSRIEYTTRDHPYTLVVHTDEETTRSV
ncbi:hypothetical protein C478_07262 [Natrinema thermotolerans DSM 11552]|nr:hypothetical protein C478_07262 [Natrinema thermotolerans DSM 11552]